MTKQSIVSILKNISNDYQVNNTVTMFHNSKSSNWFAIRITVGTIYCGTIYCDCIRIDNDSELIQFINNGEIISIFSYLSIDEIDLLD